MTLPRYRIMMALMFTLGTRFQEYDSDVKCRDDEGHEVDWYILYKLPKVKGGGLSYLYMDERTNGWILSEKTINSTSGTLANTLKPLFDYYDRKTEHFGYILYNDQPTNNSSASSSYGHSKGVVMLNKRTGVWLSHSAPKFPTYRSKVFWPDNAITYAQTFMCVTYSYGQFKEIGLQLKYIHPYSYDSDVSTTFHNELRCVTQRGCYPKKKPFSRVKNLISLRGRSFSSFAKYTRFADDLYSGLIVNSMKQDLYVMSWRSALHSNCSADIPYNVYNVKQVRLPNKVPFKYNRDHSKWCVTRGGDWTCIADMNRKESQMKRGGGAICIENRVVARAFSTMIEEHEPCPPELPHSDAQHREL